MKIKQRGFTLARTSKSRGFTLIELLVVIAIIALLASIILASLNSARQKGRDAARVSDIKEVQLALELYYDANNGYPPEGSSPYAIPSDLATQGDISAVPTDPGSYTYQYYAGNTAGGSTACTSGVCQNYLLVAQLESGPQAGGNVTDDNVYGSSVNCAATSSAPYTYCVTN